MIINVIILVVIDGYFINGYWWIFVIINVIILVVIDGYFINGYWWIFVIINVIILMTILLIIIGWYFINGYWWLLMLLYYWLFVATLALGSWPKQRLARVQANSEAWESHFMFPWGWECSKMWKNWQFDSSPLKIRNWLDFLGYRWCVTYCWKALDKGYNLCLDNISIRGLHKELCALKVVRVPTLGISGLALGSLKTKCHLNAGLVASHTIYYKGEGGAFPQVWAVMSLVSLSLPMARASTKYAPVMH
jgi:hypothetical protein